MKKQNGEELTVEEQQLRILKKQLMYSRMLSCMTILLLTVVLVVAAVVVPKVNKELDDMNVIVSDLQDADLSGMVKNINDLTVTSQSSIADATEKLDKIDLDSLNQAIQDLKTISGQIVQLLHKFGL